MCDAAVPRRNDIEGWQQPREVVVMPASQRDISANRDAAATALMTPTLCLGTKYYHFAMISVLDELMIAVFMITRYGCSLYLPSTSMAKNSRRKIASLSATCVEMAELKRQKTIFGSIQPVMH